MWHNLDPVLICSMDSFLLPDLAAARAADMLASTGYGLQAHFGISANIAISLIEAGWQIPNRCPKL
jgi:hypothetical protein